MSITLMILSLTKVFLLTMLGAVVIVEAEEHSGAEGHITKEDRTQEDMVLCNIFLVVSLITLIFSKHFSLKFFYLPTCLPT